jgi:hypothetical protein
MIMLGKNSMTLRSLAAIAAVAAATALMMTGTSAALASPRVGSITGAERAAARLASAISPATSYPEYVISDQYGTYLTDTYGANGTNGVEMYAGPAEYAANWEYRNESVYKTMDVYELYDPITNKCVVWDGQATNRFSEAGCVTGSANEDFWYGEMSGGYYSELYNVGATESYGDDRCLSALGSTTGDGLAAYLCSDDSPYQVWTRVETGTS